jgi:hypothetical protein
MDGEMVAAFLADRNVGIKNEVFDESEFQLWLEQCPQP